MTENASSKKQLPKWRIIFILSILMLAAIIFVVNVSQGDAHAQKWNTYSAQLRPLLEQQDSMINKISVDPDDSHLPTYLVEARTLETQIKAIDGENEEIEEMHFLMEQRANFIVQALEILSQSDDKKAPEVQKKVGKLASESQRMITEFGSQREQYAEKYHFIIQ
jgi:hypothetical protein